MTDPSDEATQGDAKSEASEIAAKYTLDEAIESIGIGWAQGFMGIVCGMAVVGDAIEMLLLSFIGPAVKCEWKLEKGVDGWITTAVFLGFFLGSSFWGFMADKYGRKPVSMFGLAATCMMGVLSAFAPDVMWLCLLRGTTGFGLSCISMATSYFSEVLPSKGRGMIVLAWWQFWTLGCILEVGLAAVILPWLGWRWLVVISSLPVGLAAFLLYFINESPFYLATKGRKEKCEEVLQSLAAMNSAELPPGGLDLGTHTSEPQPSYCDVFSSLMSPGVRMITFLLTTIFFVTAFTYYGGVLLASEILSDSHGDGCDMMKGDYKSPLSGDDFYYIFINSLAEIPGSILCVFTVDWIQFGRIGTLGSFYAISILGFLPLFFPIGPHTKTGFLFISRSMVTANFNVVYLYTAEVFPTTVRSTASGILSGFARFGGMLAPLVAQSLNQLGYEMLSYALFTASAVIGTAASFALPVETRGRALPANMKAVLGDEQQSVDEVQPLTAAATKQVY